MKYAHVIDNELRGWYDGEMHTTIPSERIEVSDEVWRKALEINANYYDEQTQSFEARDLRTTTEIERERKLAEIDNLKQYLADTDFYYAREKETGEAAPEAVVAKRLEARNKIRELEVSASANTD